MSAPQFFTALASGRNHTFELQAVERQPTSATLAQLSAALKADLKTTAQNLRRVGIRALGLNGGIPVIGVQALVPGTLRVDSVIAGKRVVLLRGARSFSKAGKSVIRLKLTKPGRKVPNKRKQSAKLKLRGSFALKGVTVRAGHNVTINRKGQR